MRTVNRTPHPVAWIPGRLDFPRHSLTLVVKGTFDLSPGGVATPDEDPLFPTGDAFHEDDVDQEGSLRYASDFAHWKPRADLLLSGTCHAPGGAPAASCPVSFAVGPYRKALTVYGDRRWEGMAGFRQVSNATPFTAMPLRYERSYGGSGDERNPVGRGSEAVRTATGEELRPLPNLEDPADPIRSARSRPAPAGFGPLAATWSDRASLLGTYKDRWLRTRWPWLPEDFDFGHYNAAPRDLQVEGYLAGDETLTLENLHPEHARYEARLPGTRVRCFLREHAAEEGAERPFYEVPMVLDTLFLDADAEQLMLVWRGRAPAQSEQLDEKSEVFVIEEPLAEEAASLETSHALFLQTLAELDREAPAEPAPAEPAPPPDEAPAETSAPSARELPREELDRQVDALLVRAGIDLKSLPQELRARVDAERDRVLSHLTKSGGAPARPSIESQLSSALSELGVDPTRLPTPSDGARRQQLRLLQEIGGDDAAALLQDPNAAPLLGTLGAVLPSVGIDPENLDPLIAEARKLRERLGNKPLPGGSRANGGAPDDRTEAETGPWTRERVEAAVARGDSLAGEDLSGLDLSGLVLDGVLLAGANLHGSDLSNASLRRARAAGVDLGEARLAGATLSEADLQQADLSDAVLEGATLDDVLLARARLPRADLHTASGEGASFVEADLSDARLSGGRFPRADFSGAVVAGAHFDEADLCDASLLGVTAANARFAGADLTRLRASDGSDFTGASFERAQGLESIWMDANLAGADFSYARMPGANFIQATLDDANLQAADLRESRFIRARLGRARMVQMNLFEGSLERADLSDADLSGSNCYGVEFLDAVLAGTRLEGANLRMTKLA